MQLEGSNNAAEFGNLEEGELNESMNRDDYRREKKSKREKEKKSKRDHR